HDRALRDQPQLQVPRERLQLELRAGNRHVVMAAGDGITQISGPRVAVVAGEGGTAVARATPARLVAVADVRVPARGAVGQRRAGSAGAGAAGLVAVARIAVAAGDAVGERDPRAAGHRIAGIGGAGIVIVAVERRAGGADGALTRLETIAHVPIAARRSRRHG